MLLNVNVPDRAWNDLDGLSVTRLGKRHKAESVVKTTNRGARLSTGWGLPVLHRMPVRAQTFMPWPAVLFRLPRCKWISLVSARWIA